MDGRTRRPSGYAVRAHCRLSAALGHSLVGLLLSLTPEPQPRGLSPQTGQELVQMRTFSHRHPILVLQKRLQECSPEVFSVFLAPGPPHLGLPVCPQATGR